jgi:outer membrane protein assembly factor BamB
MTIRKACTGAAILAVACVHAASASDWPQWLGPNRDNVSRETGLLKEWPKDGPPLKWKATIVGEGYSAPSVAKGRIYLLGMFEDAEHCVCLDEKDGSKIWSQKIGKVGVNPKQYFFPGPRGTPTIVGDKIYTLGSDGDLVCLDAVKGDIVWAKSLRDDFSGSPGTWVYAESPLVDGDRVVVSPGGSDATVVALDKKDGKLIWKSAIKEGDKSAYGSPIKIEVGGIQQYVVYLAGGLVGVSAADGAFLWRFKKTGASNGINIPTPIYHDGLVFVANGYKTGGGAAKLAADGNKVTATEAWFDKKLESQVGGFFRVGDHLYGSVTAGAAKLMCLELATGKVVWEDPSVGACSLCVVNGMLIVRGYASGNVALVEATPAGYKERGRFTQPDRNKEKQKKLAWPYPVVANGSLYLRDQGVLLSYDLRDGGKK